MFENSEVYLRSSRRKALYKSLLSLKVWSLYEFASIKKCEDAESATAKNSSCILWTKWSHGNNLVHFYILFYFKFRLEIILLHIKVKLKKWSLSRIYVSF